MKITFEGSFEEIQFSLLSLFGQSVKQAKESADQAAAAAAKADSAARHAETVALEIKNHKGESK